ncbi:MAG: hypothetical protein EAX81_00220 [Candidatus Thorarchaeota archaeon]|nr:hypothetical protein [Candidatus Thorarchaeota archaeon]
MDFHVIKIDVEKLGVLKSALLKDSRTLETRTKTKFESFRLSFGEASIIAYTTGKVVASDIYSRALLQNSVQEIYKSAETESTIIGSDEAGKGEWLGPLVISAVALNSLQSAILRSLGVMDSKELKLKQIYDLAKDVKRNCISFKVVLLSPETFNRRFDELKREGKNLNDLLAWGHAKAISECRRAVKEDGISVVIDEFSRIKTKLRLERVLDTTLIRLIQKPRAEDVMAVAAASIVARDAREIWLDSQSRKMELNLRELNPSSVAKRADRFLIAKVSYLK